MSEERTNCLKPSGSQSHRIHCYDRKGGKHYFDVMGDRANAEWHFRSVNLHAIDERAWIPKFITENYKD